MSDLKLVALDAEDLAILSAHLQDAVVKVADMAYLPREQRFAALANRFDWTTAAAGDAPQAASGAGQPGKRGGQAFVRRRSAIRFERVMAARVQGIDLKQKSRVLSLLAIQFEARSAEDPAGAITLVFAGGSAIRLEVECIEAELSDLGAAWSTKSKPQHPGTEDAKG